jgi:cell division septation protein DedD
MEPTTPSTLHPFEDSAEDESGAAPAAASRTSVAGAATPPAKGAAHPAKAAAPAAKSSAPAPGRVWVQAASLSSHDEANALGARLSKHGFHAVVLAGSGPKGKVYRVRVGPFRNEDEAAHAVSKLTKQEKIREPWIVPEGK